jgi:hypothetical protein
MGLTSSAYAQMELVNPLKADSFGQLIKNILDIITNIALPIAALFIIWAGFLFVTARGSETQITKARTTFLWTIIGTAIVVGAKVIATAIIEFTTSF